jgi:hypothetical protein
MAHTRFLFGCLLLGTAFFHTAAWFSQTTASQKKMIEYPSRITMHIDNGTVEEAFVHLLSSVRFPGGVVLTPNCCRARYTFEIKDLTLIQALDYVSSYDPSYAWETSNGAIYLHPKEDIPSLLQTRIIRFVRGPDSIDGLKSELAEMPEIKAAEAKLSLHPARVMGGLNNPAPARFRIELNNVTLSEALNALVAKHGTAIWQYGEDRSSHEFNIIFLVR